MKSTKFGRNDNILGVNKTIKKTRLFYILLVYDVWNWLENSFNWINEFPCLLLSHLDLVSVETDSISITISISVIVYVRILVEMLQSHFKHLLLW